MRSARKPLAAKLTLLALNLALAVTFSLLAPDEPLLNDREAYDYVGAHPLQPSCPFSIYCYRPMAPVLVHALPIDADTSWRVYQVTANTAAGVILAGLTTAPVLASVMIQTSYGFTFTAYDPYAADPLVFVFAALLIWCWHNDRVRLAIGLAAIGIFAKETVALVAGALAIAALVTRQPRWLMPAVISGTLLATFHVVSRVWLGWEIASNPAAQLSHGSWLGLWLRNNPSHLSKLYMLFAVFGFAWIFAVLGCRHAETRWRALAIGTIPPMLLLIVAQTPERAISNAFYVVVPLAAMVVASAPVTGTIAVVLNGLVTAKAGTSSAWLPSAKWTLIPAAIAAAVLVVGALKNERRP